MTESWLKMRKSNVRPRSTFHVWTLTQSLPSLAQGSNKYCLLFQGLIKDTEGVSRPD